MELIENEERGEDIVTNNAAPKSGLGRLATVRFAPGRIIPAALTIVSTPILARVLGASDYGLLAIAVTATLLAASVIFGWSEIVAVRELVDREASVEQLVGTSSVFFFVSAAVAVVAVAVFAVFGGDWLLVAAIGCATIAWGAVTFWSGAMRGRGNATGFAATTSIAAGGRAVLGVPAALIGLGPAGVLAGWAIGSAVATWLAVRRLGVRIADAKPQLPSRAFLAFAIPAAAVTSCFLALSLCDRLLLAAFRSNAEVGTYALGYAIVEQSMVLCFSILQASGFPRLLSVLSEHGYEAGSSEIAKYISVAVTVVGVVALPVAFFGTHLIELFGGDEFAGSSAAFMPFVVVGVLLLGISQYLSVPLQHQRDTGRWAVTLVFAAAVNIGANLLLIPPYGLAGAAVATALGYLVLAWLCARESARAGARPLRSLSLVPAIAATLVGGTVAGLALGAGLWVAGLVATPIAYAVTVFALRGRLDWSVA